MYIKENDIINREFITKLSKHNLYCIRYIIKQQLRIYLY